MVIPNEQLTYPKYLLKRHKLGKQSLPESNKQHDDKAINDQVPDWSRHNNQHEEPKVTQNK